MTLVMVVATLIVVALVVAVEFCYALRTPTTEEQE